MSQKLCCLGTAGYHPNDQRQSSTYFLPGLDIAIDAGSGFYRSFKMLSQPELHILLSHAHLDHVIGLTFLWNAYHLHKGLESVHVWAESDKIKAIKEHVFSELIFPVVPKIQWHEIACNELWKIGTTSIASFPLEHPGGCIGFRLDHGKSSLGYVSDTTTHVDSNYWPVVRNVNLLVHECNFRADQAEFAMKTGHSDLGTLATCLESHKVRRALLTHFNTIDDDLTEDVKKLKLSMPGLGTEILLAKDHQELEF